MSEISDSDWGKLDLAGQAEFLRLMQRRHTELLDGQSQARHRLGNVELVQKLMNESLIKGDMRMTLIERGLKTNTEATERTEGMVDKIDKNTSEMVTLWKDASGFFSFIVRIGEWGRKLAWVLIPFALLAGAWTAARKWMGW